MDKLKELVDRCKCEVSVTFNGHTSNYESVADHLDWFNVGDDELSPEVREEMIKRNTVVHVQFYPRTPVGFNLVFHYDLDAALTEALESLEE